MSPATSNLVLSARRSVPVKLRLDTGPWPHYNIYSKIPLTRQRYLLGDTMHLSISFGRSEMTDFLICKGWCSQGYSGNGMLDVDPVG